MENFMSLLGAATDLEQLSDVPPVLPAGLGPVLMDFPEDQKMAAPGGDAAWGEDEEDGVHGGVKEAFRSKPRFSYTEVKLLLDEVKKNRHILLSEWSVSPSPWQPHQNLCSDAVSNVSVSS